MSLADTDHLPFHVRDERPSDAASIRSVIDAAFAEAPHAGGHEAAIVAGLRRAGALTLSLVAEEAGSVIGHVAFSPVSIDGAFRGWFGLGPVAVAPMRQGAGVGSALIREGLLRLRETGACGCVVLGEPAYYARFGFVSGQGLVYPGPPPEFFQSLAFVGDTPRGIVAYHPAFTEP